VSILYFHAISPKPYVRLRAIFGFNRVIGSNKIQESADRRYHQIGIAMRREPDFFEDQELILIYMARRLKNALAVERIFTDGGVDYHLETGPYQSGLLFRTTKVGVFFYSRLQDAELARSLLLKNGYKAYR
jgi:hypothetical protein